MSALQILREKMNDGIVLLTLRGFLDARTYEDLEKAFDGLFEGSLFRVAVDLAGVDYIASSGVGVFINKICTARENGGNVVLIRPTANVKEVFELVGLYEIGTFRDSRDEAVRALR